MAKKKNVNNKQIATLVSVLLGVIAVIMIFLPAIGVKDSETTYTGLQIVFGYSEKTVLGTAEFFAFSFMNLLTYILAIAGVVFAVLSYLGKGSKFASLIALVAFAIAGVFFFLQVAFCVPNEGLESIVSGMGGLFGKETSIKDSLSLAVGSIIGAIASILSALAMAYNTFTK